MELSSTILSVILLLLLYTLYGIIYRLYFSPIASFPGPKLAAVTWWYEVYYDVYLGGKYIWKIQELHKQYGPIVRINPYLFHVYDPDFWDEEENELESVLLDAECGRLQPVIDERVGKMIERFEGLSTEGKVINIEHTLAAFTNDVVIQYSFGHSDHRLEKPDFDPIAFEKVAASTKTAMFMKHFSWIVQILLVIPDSVALKMGKNLASLVLMRRERIPQIEEISSQKVIATFDDENATIFHTLLASDLPESEKAPERMSEEAALLVGAGTNTKSWALSVACFHLLSQPSILRKLKTELEVALPDPNAHISVVDLEKLPYLTAVCKEGLRLSYGNTSRVPRVAPDTTMIYKSWKIPPGTPVCMDIVSTHHNEDVYPDSFAFKPERWLGKDAAALEKYFVPFLKGPRMCLGLSLAWAEMYLALTGIWTRFGSREVKGNDDIGVLELFETDEGDVTLASDYVFGAGKEGSLGVRVKVSR